MIHQISLNDCLEPCAPPAKVLTLGALDDTVFVRICEVEQDSRSEKQTEVAEISVSLPSLLEAVTVLLNDQERENLRPLDHDGKTRETRLAGMRHALAPSGPSSFVGARTVHHRYAPLPDKPGTGETAESAGSGEVPPP